MGGVRADRSGLPGALAFPWCCTVRGVALHTPGGLILGPPPWMSKRASSTQGKPGQERGGSGGSRHQQPQGLVPRLGTRTGTGWGPGQAQAGDQDRHRLGIWMGTDGV